MFFFLVVLLFFSLSLFFRTYFIRENNGTNCHRVFEVFTLAETIDISFSTLVCYAYNKTIQLYYPSSCICSPRSIVNGTIDRARFGKKKKRWNVQFNRYSVPSSYKDSISFLINQFHCDIFEGSYPRREFKSVKDISFDAGEIDGKGIGRMIYGNDFSTCLFLIYYTREMCPLQYRISLGDLWKEMKFKLRYFRL